MPFLHSELETQVLAKSSVHMCRARGTVTSRSPSRALAAETATAVSRSFQTATLFHTSDFGDIKSNGSAVISTLTLGSVLLTGVSVDQLGWGWGDTQQGSVDRRRLGSRVFTLIKRRVLPSGESTCCPCRGQRGSQLQGRLTPSSCFLVFQAWVQAKHPYM